MAEPGGESSKARIVRRAVVTTAGVAALGVAGAFGSGGPTPVEAAGPSGSPTATATPDLNRQIAANRTAVATAVEGNNLAATATAVKKDLDAALGTPTETATPTRTATPTLTPTVTPTPTGEAIIMTKDELNQILQRGGSIALAPAQTAAAGQQRKADEDEFNPKLAAANATVVAAQQEVKQEKGWEPGWLQSLEHVFMVGGIAYGGWRIFKHFKKDDGGHGH